MDGPKTPSASSNLYTTEDDWPANNSLLNETNESINSNASFPVSDDSIYNPAAPSSNVSSPSSTVHNSCISNASRKYCLNFSKNHRFIPEFKNFENEKYDFDEIVLIQKPGLNFDDADLAIEILDDKTQKIIAVIPTHKRVMEPIFPYIKAALSPDSKWLHKTPDAKGVYVIHVPRSIGEPETVAQVVHSAYEGKFYGGVWIEDGRIELNIKNCIPVGKVIQFFNNEEMCPKLKEFMTKQLSQLDFVEVWRNFPQFDKRISNFFAAGGLGNDSVVNRVLNLDVVEFLSFCNDILTTGFRKFYLLTKWIEKNFEFVDSNRNDKFRDIRQHNFDLFMKLRKEHKDKSIHNVKSNQIVKSLVTSNEQIDISWSMNLTKICESKKVFYTFMELLKQLNINSSTMSEAEHCYSTF